MMMDRMEGMRDKMSFEGEIGQYIGIDIVDFMKGIVGVSWGLAVVMLGLGNQDRKSFFLI